MSAGDAKPSSRPTRRGFGRSLAVGGVFTLVGGAAAGQARPKAVPVEEALLAVVRARYGKHLTAEQLEAIQGSLQRGLARAEEMKGVPLTNVDEPAFAFRADL